MSTPDIPTRDSAEVFETPEQEAARRRQTEKINSHDVANHILEGSASPQKKRPEISKQRFPSRDIWEDAPDSQQLVTTVEPAADEVKSPEATNKPAIPRRPSKPSTSPTEKRQPPEIPERPKPQVPTRPAKPSSKASAEKIPVTGTFSKDATEAPAVPKAKPAVPARPGGSKIAALKAGFLTDLNSRLQLGPQQHKPQEKEPEPAAEKQPLSDARKGRARGPARRKPAVEKKTEAILPAIPEIKLTESWNVWQVGEDGSLTVGSETKDAELAEPSATSDPISASEEPLTPELSKDTAGESTDPAPESAEPESTPDETTAAPVKDVTPPATGPSSKEDEPEKSLNEKIAEEKSDSKEAAELATFTKLNETLQDQAEPAEAKKASEGESEAVSS